MKWGMTFLFAAQAVVSAHVYAADINTAQDAEALLFDAQDRFISLSPPSEQVYAHRDGVIHSVDWTAMPDGIKKGLPPGMIGGLPVYELRVSTDPFTRETVFHNKWDTEVYRMVASNVAEDAFGWMKARFNVASPLQLDEWTRWIYDPAHISVTLYMVPETLRDSFVETMEENTALAMEYYAPMTMMASSSSAANFTISATGVTNGLVELTVEWVASFTNKLEVFATPDLVEPEWELALTNILTSGTATNHVWEDADTGDFNERFYIVGNVGLDTDFDSLPDAREIYLHGTATNVYDMDGDGLGDGEEVNSNGQFGDTDGYITNPFRPDRVDYSLPAPVVNGPNVSLSMFEAFDPPTTNLVVSTNAPAISEWLRMADAGETVTLSAEALSDTSRFLVFGQSTAGKVLSDGQILRREDRLAAVRMPGSLPTDSVYLLWPRNEHGYGEPVAVNQAEAWWVGPDEVATNEAFSVFGRNLSLDGAPCHLYIEEATQWIESVSTTPYKADFVWPTNLTGSTYTLWAHNGQGREHGWSDSVQINIITNDLIIWDGPTVNVMDYGATGNGYTNDAVAIASAIQALNNLKEAGHYGTVYFPSGTYLIRDRITNIGLRKRLLGEGATNTVIITDVDEFDGNSNFGMVHGDLYRVEINGIGMEPGTNYQGVIWWNGSFTKYVDFVNCRFSQILCSSQKNVVDISNTKYMRFKNCEFEINHNVYCGGVDSAFFKDCVFRGLRDANALLNINGAERVSITGSSVGPYDVSSATNGLGWLKGRFVTGNGNSGAMRNIHIADNATSNMCPRYGMPFFRESPTSVGSLGWDGGSATQQFVFASLNRDNGYGVKALLSTNSEAPRTKYGLNVISWDLSSGTVVLEGDAGGLLNPPTTNITAVFWDHVDDNSGEQILFEGLETKYRGSVVAAVSNEVTCSGLSTDYTGQLLVVVSGRGMGQSRSITSVDTGSGVVTMDNNWQVVPDTNSVVMIGHYVDHAVVHDNQFGGDERANDPYFFPDRSSDLNYTNNTATCGVSFYGAVLGSVVEGNVIAEVRTGLRNWSLANTNDAETAVVIQPNYFNLFAYNTISDSAGGLADTFDEPKDGAPLQDIAIAGTVWRGNAIEGLTAYSLESHANYDSAHLEMNVFENNEFEGGLTGVWSLDDARSPVFMNNHFAASGTGVVYSIQNALRLHGNLWSGFDLDYAGSTPGAALLLPVSLVELTDRQTNAVLDVWNVGTSNLSWTASTSASWISLKGSNGVVSSEVDIGSIAFSIDPANVPTGVSNGTITVIGGGATNDISVLYE